MPPKAKPKPKPGKKPPRQPPGSPAVLGSCSVSDHPDLKTDFLEILAPGEDLGLPDNGALPYAHDVPNEKLFQVSRFDETSLLDDLQVSDSTPEKRKEYKENEEVKTKLIYPDGKLIYAAYQRVTGHAILDDPAGLFDPSKSDTDMMDGRKRFMYCTYAHLHKNLILCRNEGQLTGEGIYYHAHRLVTYAQQLHPDRGLGPSEGGKCWIAPPPYHIVCYNIHGGDGSNTEPPARACAFGDEILKPNIGGCSYGFDRPEDPAKFDRADFTFHFVNTVFNKVGDGHWSLIIRHKASNKCYYLDSLWDRKLDQRKGETVTDLNAYRQAILDRVLPRFNDWLRRSGKTEISELLPIDIPRQQETNACGPTLIANILAFICYGRLGWNAVNGWIPTNGGKKKPNLETKKEAEQKMVKDVGRSLHKLMGIAVVDWEEDQELASKLPSFDKKLKDQYLSWKPSPKPGPVKPVQPEKVGEKLQKIKEEEGRLAKLKEDLDKVKSQLDGRKAELDKREARLNGQQAELDRREAALKDHSKPDTAQQDVEAILRRESWIETEETRQHREQLRLQKKEEELEARERSLDQLQAQLAERDLDLRVRAAHVKAREAQLAKESADIQARLEALNRRSSPITSPHGRTPPGPILLEQAPPVKTPPGFGPTLPNPPAPGSFGLISTDEEDTFPTVSETFEIVKRRNQHSVTDSNALNNQGDQLEQVEAEEPGPYDWTEEDERFVREPPSDNLGDEGLDDTFVVNQEGQEEQPASDNPNDTPAIKQEEQEDYDSPENAKRRRLNESSPLAHKTSYIAVGSRGSEDSQYEVSGTLKGKMGILAAETDHATRKRKRSLEFRRDEVRKSVSSRESQSRSLTQSERETLYQLGSGVQIKPEDIDIKQEYDDEE